jgi:DNA-binding transcriptional LysR family regulator
LPFYESVQLSDLNGERFIVRTHCEMFDSATKLMAEQEIRPRVVYRTDQDDRALALVGAGLGIALMPAIFDAPNVKKLPVRDFDASRVISLHWNKDNADDRLSRFVTFTTTHNWASSDLYGLKAFDRFRSNRRPDTSRSSISRLPRSPR